MTVRLLSFLNQIMDGILVRENSIPEGTRMVNFAKSIARYSMKDGGAIQVQSFVLADGQFCIKVALYWAGIQQAAMQSVYPATEAFDYGRAAGKIAQLYIDGPIAAGINFGGSSDSAPALSKLSSVGA